MNRISRFKLLGAVLLFSALCLGPAKADMITLNYSFTASGFAVGAPFDPIFGSFSVTFDNASSITNSSAVVAMINLPTPGGINFSYDMSLDLFVLGGALNGADDAFTGTDDFLLILGGVSTGNPTFAIGDFVYTSASVPKVGFFPTSVMLTQSVPDEASTLGLLAAVFAGLVWLRRFRLQAIA